MLDLIVYSILIAAIVILMFGALGACIVLGWFLAAVIAWERTR